MGFTNLKVINSFKLGSEPTVFLLFLEETLTDNSTAFSLRWTENDREMLTIEFPSFNAADLAYEAMKQGSF